MKSNESKLITFYANAVDPIEVDTVDAPAYWAGALVNGDASGLNEHEKIACSKWMNDLGAGGWYVVSTVDDSECIGRFEGLQTNMVTYVIHRVRK